MLMADNLLSLVAINKSIQQKKTYQKEKLLNLRYFIGLTAKSKITIHA